jgi:5'-nucleotidase
MRRTPGVRLLSCLTVVALLLAGGARSSRPFAQSRPEPPPYRILITNDDGVRAPGIAAVAQVLQAIGTVIIVAPAEQQSATGHGLITRDPIFRQDLTLPNGLKAIGLTTTPASAVRIAMRAILPMKPDLVVSGINRGYNLGYSGYVSGTLAAARDGAMFGVPAVAASLAEAATPNDYVAAAEEVLGVARRVKQFGLAPNTFLNVNIPPRPAEGYRGYRLTTQALAGGGDESFVEMKDPSGRSMYWNVFKEGGSAPEGTDMWAVAQGFVSVTPMKLGESDASQLEPLKKVFE